MKKTFKKITALVLCLIMLIGIVPLTKNLIPATVSANAEGDDTEETEPDVDSNSFLSYDAEPDDFKNTTNPFGYGKGVPFAYTTYSETFFYKCADKKAYGSVYDKMTKSDRTFDGDTTLNSTVLTDISNLSFTQAVGFDADGTGRNRYVGIVGVDTTDKNNPNVVVYVYDAKSNKKIGSTVLGKMTNVEDDTNFYAASNHLSIVAGDFNGDNKESLIVYATVTKDTANNQDSGKYGLFEITMNYNSSGTLSGVSCTQKSGYKTLLNPKYRDNASSILTSEYHADDRNKLCVSMAVGDINNDRIDDLVVLSYMDVFSKQKDVTYLASMPYLGVSYGSAQVSSISNKINESFYVTKYSDSNKDSDEKKKYETIASAGVAVTNADGEYGDEIIVAGETLLVEENEKDGNKYVSDTRTETIRIARYAYDFETEKINRNYICDGQSENKMTKHCIESEDSVFAQIKVTGVYMNGTGNPASIFINGDIYDLSEGSIAEGAAIEKEYTYAEVDKNVSDRNVQFIYTFATGNFSHNETGFEQISFIVAEKEKGKDDYDLYWATVDKDANGNYTGTADIRTDNSKTELWDGKGDNLDERLSVLVADVDVDNDGIIAKYNGVQCIYSDPDVLAILQAGPYFDDLSEFYSNNNETSYSIKETRSSEKAKSDSVSFSYCVTAGFDLEELEFTASLGYALDWTQSYAESIEYELEKTWKAQGEDTVVVYRTPVYVYSFDTVDKNGNWLTNQIHLSVPMKPVFTTMTVPEYNDFCVEYNTLTEGQKLAYTMTEIDVKSNHLGNEGNPYGYITSNATTEDYKTFGELQTPGTADACVEVTYSKTEVSSVTTEIAHGLHFGAELTAGKIIKVGVEENLDYLKGKSSTESFGTGTSFICNIQNPVKSAMIDAGYTDEQCAAYSFSWKLATWDSGISALDGQKVPIVGYVLSNVKALPHPPINPDAVAYDENEDGINDHIEVTWEKNTDGTVSSSSSYGYPDVSSYNVYLEDKKGNRTLIKERTTETTFTYPIDDDNKDYTFVIRGVWEQENLETLDCSVICDALSALVSIKSIDKISYAGNVDTYKITYTGTKAATYFYVTNGESAYDVAVKNGYKGTWAQWLEIIGANCQYVGHSYDETKIDATCTSGGYTIHKCSKCGDVVIDNFVNALGHNYSKQVVEPTCTDMGYTVYTCSRCNEKHVDDVVPAIGHKYSATVVEPTCTDMGYTKYTCETCGESYVDDIVPATEHDYEAVVTAPTCTEKGYTTYTCKNCGDQYVSNIEETIEHKYKTKTVENTCVSGGYTIKYCEDCGYQEIINETAAKSHSFEVTSVKEATCMSKGYSTYTCKDCGVSYIGDETEPVEHSYEDKIVVPDCNHEGYTIHTCTACGTSKVDTYTDKTEHTPGEWFCDDYAVGHYIKRCEKCYCKLDEKTVSVSIGGGDGETKIAQGESVNVSYGEIIDLNIDSESSNFRYVSSDTDVATINESGEVEAVGAGTAIITITDEDTGITTSFTVKIAKPWWQKVHDILSNIIPFKILFMLFGIRY